MNPMPFNENVVVADRFQLVRELGRGAMGSVWLARHLALHIPCAVKFMSEHGAAVDELRMRFEREACAAARIRSPYVVQILDYGIWQAQPYIAMEYLEGESLGARLLRLSRLPVSEIFAIATQIAQGLTKAHALGIVHRDLKPDNIFLVREENVFTIGPGSALAALTVKILDFGIAKSPNLGGERFSRTRTGTLLGTPYYMSPEQAEGARSIDARSDLWSLAVVIYQCFVGRLPFESDALGDLLMRVMHSPLPVPSRGAPGIPSEFDAWWARAAARDPAQRFQSAGELVTALGPALGVGSGPWSAPIDAVPGSLASSSIAGLTPPPTSLGAIRSAETAAIPDGADAQAHPRTLLIGYGLDAESSTVAAGHASSALRRPGWLRAALGALAALTLIAASVLITRRAGPFAAAVPDGTLSAETAPALAPTASMAAAAAEDGPLASAELAGPALNPASSDVSATNPTASAPSADPLLSSPPVRGGVDAGRARVKHPKRANVGF